MNQLQQLQEVLENERQALLTRDWPLLEQCTRQKQALVEPLGQLLQAEEFDAAILRPQLFNIRQNTSHNAKLADGLSRQVASMLKVEQRPTVYNRLAKVAPSSRAVMHRLG